MTRYHIKVGFDPKHIKRLQDITSYLNEIKWQHCEHFLDNLKYRVIDIESILRHIKDTTLEYGQIFEYYFEQDIIKICYRISYSEDLDIILVLTTDKKIITIYLNSADDKHDTLKKELYNNITLTK